MQSFARKHPYLTLFSFSLFLYLIGNNLLPITDTAESNYAETAREMVISGDYISPQIYGNYWYDKPIFYYWELALSFYLFGFNEMAARLPAAILGIFSLLFTYWFARHVYGEKVGWLSSIILGTSLEFWLLSKAVITDSTLFLFMSGAIASFYLGYAESRKYYWLCYIFAALATLTKGPIGLLIPGLAAILFLVYNKDLKEIKKVHLCRGLLLFAVLCGSWYGLMCYLHGSQFLLNFLGVHNFLRATVAEHPSHNKWYFYILIYIIGFTPWSLTLPYSVYKRWKDKKLDFRSANPCTQLLLIYAITVNVFFQCIATKYTTYTFPGLFSLAILTALIYQSWQIRLEKIALGAMALYTVSTLFLAPSIMLSRSGKEVGIALKQMDTSHTPIVFLHDYRTSAVFYSGKIMYRGESAKQIEKMKPGTLSWNAKNVMPFMAEEDLMDHKNTILIVDKEKEKSSIAAYLDDQNAYEVHIPGNYTLWVTKG